MRLTVHEFMTLDGVVQGPGAPDEDPRDGFTAGGWVVPFADDPVFGEVVGDWFGRTDELLFGRTTWELMRAYWPQVTGDDNPAAVQLNGRPKHVVTSSALGGDWAGSVRLEGDVLEAVTALKERDGGELQVHGCARLAATLHAAGLVDEYRLLVAPVTVGHGRRLFGTDAVPRGYDVVDHRSSARGLTYLALTPRPYEVAAAAVVDGRDVVVPV
ncbi:dihydrofolate reductase family protein [Cellulomonas shaoxiangyii]|uniref:Dihydrofolate reductase n=1 Tax=Cellulomonas shaoxiangyii TaxID=2566013 RepID=A0A4P7SE17_9CELL|nr:dihydrofolate reductase family protein [Cellulomonas shaoxiangyii]QCB92252.1 dihydrofolate reductase [Cellulomonas shaoxiangyii]TGY85936.1 dihydrofolate reductase [Cellulomonas shaoxiangyii]